MNFCGIREDAVLLVAPHGTVFPARLPQLVNNGHVLIGGVVPTIVVGLGRQTHAACRAVEIAGHDVPADPAAGQVVQRRHATGGLNASSIFCSGATMRGGSDARST